MSDQAIRAMLRDAIRAHPAAAADALTAIQLGQEGQRLHMAALKDVAPGIGRDPEEFAVEQIAFHGLLAPLAHALATRGVPLPEDWEETLPRSASTEIQEEEEEEDGDDLVEGIPDEVWSTFGARARATRCCIRVGTAVRGSGVLVGPTTVLTAWHVVRDAERIDVEFADKRRIE
ncbi:MAG: serine protease, partial [Pseudomonadota bacterium]|nr:serine protease [Pseudomonadota bacterium]